MNLHDAITGRRSVRDYRPEPVPEATLRELIAAAVLAPSAMNEQPWLFAVVRDAALLDRISELAKRHILAVTPPGPQAEHLKAFLRDGDFHIFYHAPALILIAGAKAGPWIAEDCSLAAQNLMLAARAAGLGTCWIGFAQGWLNTAEGKALLGLPPECQAVAPIIVGVPKTVPAPAPRKPPVVLAPALLRAHGSPPTWRGPGKKE